MKTKLLLGLTVIAMSAAFATPAHAGFSVHVSIGVPHPTPVVVLPPQPPPCPAPVVVHRPAPVCPPAVVVTGRCTPYHPAVFIPPGHLKHHHRHRGHGWEHHRWH